MLLCTKGVAELTQEDVGASREGRDAEPSGGLGARGGVEHADYRAVDAYRQWRNRVNQPEDPPLVRAGRAYYMKCNRGYIDDLAIPAWLKRRMDRIIAAGYPDVARRADEALDFDELTRAA